MARAPIFRLPYGAREYGTTESSSEPSDAELVGRVRSGDGLAEHTLFTKHAGYILALSFRLLRDHAESEDVLQETFLDAIAQMRALAGPVSLRPWLAGIAVHKVHRRFRRRKLQAVLGLFRPSDDSVLEDSAHPSTSPELRTELALLDTVLARLPELDRAAWVLRYVEGYVLDEVARLCQCSLATAKRRIGRAHRVVQVHVSFEGADNG